MPPMPRTVATCAALLLALPTAACATGSSPSADPGRVDLATSLYPLQFVAERVGGDAVNVRNLVPPGVEPHDLELSAGQVGQLTEAELVVYLSGFQPAVDEAVEQNAADRAFDVAEVEPLLDAAAGGHSHEEHEGEGEAGHEGEGEAGHEGEGGGKDPHVWLDPERLATIGDKLADRLAELDPERADGYAQRAAALRADLDQLDKEYSQGLQTCQRREMVVSHAAFAYLAKRYELEQIAISGLSPEDEPTPQRLAEVTREAKEHGATTIFFESLVSPKVAQTIAQEVGATTAVLDPIEGLAAGGDGDYLSLMRENLAALRTALGCS